MGLMRSCLTFMAGTAAGVYIAQNYNVPNVKNMANMAMAIAKAYESNYRKPKNGGDSD